MSISTLEFTNPSLGTVSIGGSGLPSDVSSVYFSDTNSGSPPTAVVNGICSSPEYISTSLINAIIDNNIVVGEYYVIITYDNNASFIVSSSYFTIKKIFAFTDATVGGSVSIFGARIIPRNISSIYFSDTNVGTPIINGDCSNISIITIGDGGSSDQIDATCNPFMFPNQYYLVIEYDDNTYSVSDNSFEVGLNMQLFEIETLIFGQYIILYSQNAQGLNNYTVDSAIIDNDTPYTLTLYDIGSSYVVFSTDTSLINEIIDKYINITFSFDNLTYDFVSDTSVRVYSTYTLGEALVQESSSVVFILSNENLQYVNGIVSFFLTNTQNSTSPTLNGDITNLIITNSVEIPGNYNNNIVSGNYYYTNMNVQEEPPNYTGPPLTTYNYSSESYEFIGEGVVICFKVDSKIKCLINNEEKDICIQDLKKGDLVKTSRDGYLPVNVVGKKKCYNPKNSDKRTVTRLYKLSKNKYPELYEDLVVTGCHSILVDFITNKQIEETKKIIKTKTLCMTSGLFRLLACIDERSDIYKDEYGDIDVYHIALGDDINVNYGIYANGLLVESCFIKKIKKNMICISE